MTEKEIKVRYKHAFLGFLWIFLNPILLMAIIGLVFQHFIPVKVDNYFLFLISGLLPWYFFSNSLTKSTPAFYYERDLIKKSKFPREVLVLSIVLSNLFHFVVSLLLLVILLIADKMFIERYSLINLLFYSGRVFLVIPATILLTVFASSLSIITGTLNVKYRDVNFITQLATSVWFYLTPIVYTLNLLPENIRYFFYINPLTIIIELYQYSLLNMPIYSIGFGLSLSLSVIAILILVSIFIFKKQSKNFDDWL
jgi:lipopolysaccharide transport system permease protein